MLAKIAVEKTAYHFDRLFDYLVPPDMQCPITPGCRVLAPFGTGNRKRQGVVFALCNDTDNSQFTIHNSQLQQTPDRRISLKHIDTLLDEIPVLTEEMIGLAEFIRDRCFCTCYEAARLMIPAGLELKISGDDSELIKRRVGDKTVRMIRLIQKDSDDDLFLTPKQSAVVELLSGFESATVREVCAIAGVTRAVLDTLTNRGVTEYFELEIGRKPKILDSNVDADIDANTHGKKGINLTGEQERAYKNLHRRYKSGEPTVTLLYGITGSGKTSVFMRLIDDILEEGKSVIVMVPEIALTPQTVGRFKGRYGDNIALLHSGLSLGQRLDEWKRIKNGSARLVVGTRSASFAPVQNLGAIMIDEEHEYTYKSESSPRYHARDVAKFRCAWHKAPLILSSATPSLESYYLATEGKKYFLEKLDSRYGGAQLPTVNIVDLSAQNLSESIISPVLAESLKYNLENGYQSILLHNRRGYNTFVACRACNHVLYCENCSVSMTYHKSGDCLVCHHCGESRPFSLKCPSCEKEQLRYSGLGTQRAEDELAALFPKARILRMDADSVGGRAGHAAKLAAFANHEYDIMIGTQMVAKGLDFERVTLVGVLLADQTLCCDDFRSYERAFALLTQVVGRSGRGAHSGIAVIQTLSPENPVFEMAASQDYVKFYNSEIGIRQSMLNPPFSDVCMIGFVGEDDESARAMSLEFLSLLKFRAGREFSGLPMRVLGPSPAAIQRVMGKYRYRMLIKCRNTKKMRELISILLREIGGNREYKDITAFADMNVDNRF